MNNPTDKVQRALREFSDMLHLQENAKKNRKELIKKVILQFDLTPLEEDFIWRHCNNEKQ